jgi:hypothetical protein
VKKTSPVLETVHFQTVSSFFLPAFNMNLSIYSLNKYLLEFQSSFKVNKTDQKITALERGKGKQKMNAVSKLYSVLHSNKNCEWGRDKGEGGSGPKKAGSVFTEVLELPW